MSTPQPFLLRDADGAAKRHAPATMRNRDAIADVLAGILPERGTILEIASGTGEHIIHFAARFPHLEWQPSDHDAAGITSIAAWCAEAGLPNIRPPLTIDASDSVWPITQVNAILCINMIHIAPWAATRGLFAAAANVMAKDAPLVLYGPFREADVPTAQSNEDFDQSLKSRNPDWGLRDREAVAAVAAQHGFTLCRRYPMPANNLALHFARLA
jgi:cyclopropane fatty-acyl-phospholipid synthase-like methyltransferase